MVDWIDLKADGLPPSDSIAVVLRLRNSLLNTVLLYDQMLSGPGVADWLITGLRALPTAMRRPFAHPREAAVASLTVG